MDAEVLIVFRRKNIMKTVRFIRPSCLLIFLAAAFAAVISFPAQAMPPVVPGYSITYLVSDDPLLTTNVDANLLNPWGLTFDESGDPIIADNADNLTTFYGSDGLIVPFSINAGTQPTGIEYNLYTNDFRIGPSSNPVPAELLICTESGTVLGFSLAVSFNTAVVVADESASHAVYTGLTIGQYRGKRYLYVADFQNGKISMFDSSFHLVKSFTDSRMEAGFAPYNVRDMAGLLYVTFAKQGVAPSVSAAASPSGAGAGPVCAVPDQGNGFVEIFTTDGQLIKRLVSHGNLNEPWGLTYVPSTFGRFGGELLVGNHGDGHINVFDAVFGNYIGQINMAGGGKALTIQDLWSINMVPHIDAEGDDDSDNPLDASVYFTAGPGGTNGVFGLLQPLLKP
jgi:uncharacterized protein (TIGR03118 family)